METLEINPNREYILAGDISGSMTNVDAKCGGNTRYKYMLEKFKMFIKTAEDFDEHGAPTIMLFGEKVHVYEHAKLETIDSTLRNVNFEGFTNLDLLLNKAFSLHLDDKKELARERKVHPGTVLLVFTDGEPTNKNAVVRELFSIVNRIDHEEEFQIHFLTVGSVDRDVGEWLDNLHDRLDDKVQNPNDFDIIHVNRLEDIDFMGTVAANRHKENA